MPRAETPSPAPSLPPETQYRPAGSDEDDPEFAVITLLAEDKLQRKYLVEWGDLDPKDGYHYRPSWEPKELCTDLLIKEWKDKIARKVVKPGRPIGEKILADWDKTKKREMARRRAAKAAKQRARSRSESAEEEVEKAGASRRTSEAAEEHEDDEDEDGMDVLRSPEDSTKKKSRTAKEKAAAKTKALADISQATTGSEWLPAGGKRKRSSVANEPKKKNRRTSKRDSSEPIAIPPPNRTTRHSIPSGSSAAPISSRVRSRSESTTVSSTTGRNAAAPEQPHSAAPARSSRKNATTSGSGTQKSTRFAVEPDAEADLEQEDDFEVVDPDPINGDGHYDDDDHGDGGYDNFHDDDEPYRSPSPKAVADKNALLAAAILDLGAGGAGGAAASPASSIDSATIAQAVSEAQAMEAQAGPSAPAPAPAKHKSKSRKEGSGKGKELAPVPQPGSQMFRVAALQADGQATQATGNGTQESEIQQFSSPIGPSKGKGKKRARRIDADEGSDEEDVPTEVDDEVPPATFEEEEEEDDSVPPGMERRVVDGVSMLRALPTQPERPAMVDRGSTAEPDLEAVPPGMEWRIIDGVSMLRAIPTQVERPSMVDRGHSAEPLPPPPAPVTPPAEIVPTPPTQFSTGNPDIREEPVLPLPIPSNPELVALNADLSAQLTSIRAELADVRARKASADRDAQFLRTQYDNASSSAVREVNRNRELDAKLKQKEEQLSTGLKQKDLHFAAVAARDRQQLTELRMQNKMLLAQARLTDDSLRAKAVAYPQTKKENENLLQENAVLERRVEALNKRNNDLADQNRALRARQMGVLQGGEGSDTDTGSEYSDEESGSEEPDMAGMGYATRAKNMTSSGEYFESAPRGGASQGEGEVQVKEEEVDVGEVVDGPGTAFVCQIRSQEGDTMCGQLLETKSTLQEHWSTIHRPHAQPMSQ